MSWRAQGMRTWIMQRLTAVYMLVYLLMFLGYLTKIGTMDFVTWRTFFVHPFTNIATGFFFFSLLYHAWVGLRDILIDYVHWGPLRFVMWVVITAGVSALGVWTIMILTSVVSV